MKRSDEEKESILFSDSYIKNIYNLNTIDMIDNEFEHFDLLGYDKNDKYGEEPLFTFEIKDRLRSKKMPEKDMIKNMITYNKFGWVFENFKYKFIKEKNNLHYLNTIILKENKICIMLDWSVGVNSELSKKLEWTEQKYNNITNTNMVNYKQREIPKLKCNLQIKDCYSISIYKNKQWNNITQIQLNNLLVNLLSLNK